MYEYNDDAIMTVEELTDTLKIGRNVAYHLLNKGIIKAFRIGRTWKIPKSSLDDFVISSAMKSCRYLID